MNDYTYKENAHKQGDSRYLHRGPMKWENVKKITDSHSVEGRIYNRLEMLEKLRKSHPAFVADADAWTLPTYEQGVLCMGRYYDGEKILGIFNFSEQDKTAWINETDGEYVDLITGKRMSASGVNIPGYGFYWLRLDSGDSY